MVAYSIYSYNIVHFVNIYTFSYICICVGYDETTSSLLIIHMLLYLEESRPRAINIITVGRSNMTMCRHLSSVVLRIGDHRDECDRWKLINVLEREFTLAPSRITCCFQPLYIATHAMARSGTLMMRKISRLLHFYSGTSSGDITSGSPDDEYDDTISYQHTQRWLKADHTPR